MAANERDDWNLADVLTELFDESIRIDQVQQRELGDAKLAIVNMRYRPTRQGTDGATRHSLVKQTAVVLDEGQLDLPRFVLAPAAKGITGALFTALGGFGDINFEDSPAFSKQYYLLGWSEEPVRVLFSKTLRDYFAAHPGWSVRAYRSQLAIFKSKKIIKDEQTDEFVGEALSILALFQQGEEALDARPDLHRETRPEDLGATAQRMGGIAGAMLQAQLQRVSVSREELERFLKASPPRKIPSGIKRQVLGQNAPLIFIGALFFVAGLIAGTCIIVFSEGRERLVGIPFLIMFPAVGGIMSLATFFHRRKYARILRQGELIEATVSKVERSGAAVNGQTQHPITFSYVKNGQPMSASSKTHSLAADLARSFKSKGTTVRLLVDPNEPTNVVCPDLLMILK